MEINEGGAWWRMVTRDMGDLGVSWWWFRDEIEKRRVCEIKYLGSVSELEYLVQ